MLIKTACSSAGIGLHEALEAIRQEKITSAIVTGSNLILGKSYARRGATIAVQNSKKPLLTIIIAPGLTISLSVLGSLSPEGSSKSFDASADGYARAEAVSAIYVKRLDEAIKDGNPIRAVIRSSATNVYVSLISSLQTIMGSLERVSRRQYSDIPRPSDETVLIT